MPEMTNINAPVQGRRHLARDAAYVAVGLGVLGYQRAQVQRVELQNKLAEDFAFDERLNGVRRRGEQGRPAARRAGRAGRAVPGDQLQPLEQQLPPTVTQVTTKAFDQAREVRSQIRQRVQAS